MNIFQDKSVDRNALTETSLHDAPDEKAYWLSRTPHERLQHIEILRRINYGHRIATRLQRILEVAKR